jgi:hypothetical protein
MTAFLTAPAFGKNKYLTNNFFTFPNRRKFENAVSKKCKEIIAQVLMPFFTGKPGF